MRTISSLRAALLGGLCVLALTAPMRAQESPLALIGITTVENTTANQMAPLPADSQSLLFSGETARRTVLFVAEPEQLVGAADLYLTVQSAVSVAPEWSRLTVAVNDQIVGTSELKAGEAYPLKWSVPSGLLQPGYNAVSLIVDQAHRVDCSVDATYELWTRIDPLQSGFVFQAGSPAAPDFTSLLAAARTLNGTTPLHGIVDAADTAGTSRLLSAFQTLAIGAAIDRPAVDFSSAPGIGPGIDLLIGGQSDLSRRLAAQDLQMPSLPGVNVGRRADGRLVVALVANTDSEFSTALSQLADGLQQAAIGSPSGLAALAQLKGLALPANGKLSFAQLGVDGRDFGGRNFTQSVRFKLPTDFYPADYAQAVINLDALYSSGLAPGAALQFKVNNRIVSTLNLSGSRSGEARDRRLPIALSAFRPGVNEIAIDATLPARMDAECAPGTTANNGRRLQLSSSSVLELPTLARVGRFPDLGALDSSITGRDAAAELAVVTPGAGAVEMGAAATFLTRLAFGSGRVVPARFAASLSADATTPQLVVGSSGKLTPDVRQRLPVDLGASPVAPAYEFMPRQPNTVAAQPASLPSVETLTASASTVFEDVKSSLYGLGKSAGLSIDVLRSDGLVAAAPVIGTDIMVAQTLNDSGAAPITVITSASDAQLAEAMPNLVGNTWSRMEGSAVALASTGELLQAVKAREVQYYPGSDSSLTNLRLVAAGWLSNTPSIYVLLVLFSALLLGVLTHVLLIRTRRRS